MLSSVQCAARPARARRAFAFRGQNEQETQPASPIDLAGRSGPKRFGQFAVRRLDSSPRTKPEETGCLFN